MPDNPWRIQRGAGMNCPKCGGTTKVEQVRRDSGRRRRRCLKCTFVFHTKEVEVPVFKHGGDRRSEAARGLP